MSNKFIYDVKSSRLYAADGTFLKKLFCPKAKHWNQLIADDPQDRSRGCESCGERVINLETETNCLPDEFSPVCVYIPANSNRVIFLNTHTEIPDVDKLDQNDEGYPIIKTVRNIRDINRAAGMGYWPDVRKVEYMDRIPIEQILAEGGDSSNLVVPLKEKISVGQHSVTGRITVSGDYRSQFRRRLKKNSKNSELSLLLRSSSYEEVDENGEITGIINEVIPFTFYYPYYQSVPIAAYLIPPNLKDGTKVLIEDPIEDLLGGTWNQGDRERAMNVIGYVKNRKVFINRKSIKRNDYIG